MRLIAQLLIAALALAPEVSAAQAPQPPIRFLPPTEVTSTVAQTEAPEAVPLPMAPQGPTALGTSPSAPEPVPAGPPMSPGPLSFALSDLEAIALGNNPTLLQASARIRAARANCIQVGLYPNPTVGYQGVEIGQDGKAGQQGIYLGQEFVLGKKRQLSRNAAAQAVRQAEQEYQAQQLRVLNDVRTGFYDTLVAQRRLEIAGQLVRIGEQGFGTTEQLLKAQEGTKADLLQSRIELNSARIVASNAQNNYLSAWRRLAAALGMPDLAPAQLTGDVEAGWSELTWEESLGKILASSPELAAARAGVEQARWALSRARAEPIPNIDLQVTLQHDNATTDDIVGVQAVLPVPLFNRNQGGISRAQAELTIASGEVQRLQLELQQRLAVAFERYANAKQQVERYSKEILPDAKASLDLVTAGYRQGEFGHLLLLTSQRTYIQTNLSYLDALRELRETSVAIEGLLLTGSLSHGAAPAGAATYPNWDASRVVPGLGR